MAPSPENDSAPKAPDKGDRTKGDSMTTAPTTAPAADAKPPQDQEVAASSSENKEASVSRLDDVELKALLDEAINYKIPKDRVGKSKLFQNLLEKAEEDDRKARATSASGSESVRYYNTTATHRTRRRREPNSVSENLTHGGSLNDLAKEELYVAASHLHRPPKTVSARQRQGGSLPCNVNAGITHDKQYFEEETRRRTEETKKAEYTAIDMESESLLEHDSLDQSYGELTKVESVQARIPLPKFTSRFNLEIGGGGGGGGGGPGPGSGNNVDDSLTVPALELAAEKATDNDVTYKQVEPMPPATHYSSATHYSLLMPAGPIWSLNRKSVEDKKVDENGNALGQSSADTKKSKKKKIQTDKNVVVLEAKDVAGHRSDIINDLDKLVEYIGGNDEQTGTKSKSNVHKAKFHKHHFGNGGGGGDDKGNKKQRVRPSKGGKAEKLQKSNSMEEISVTKLDDFAFAQDSDGSGKAPLRGTKSNADRPRERRSWGNSESLPLHASAENLESSDFRVVTKKKKSKKRRNSVGGRRQPYSRDMQGDGDFNRMPSPEPRRKSACSAPHSDKSNDSSDADSVHSLPVGTDRMAGIDADRLGTSVPASYADIAKNSGGGNPPDRPKWNRPPSERKGPATTERGSEMPEGGGCGVASVKTEVSEKPPPPKAARTYGGGPPQCAAEPHSPPDVHNIQNWPTIQNNNGNNNNKSGAATVANLLPLTKNSHSVLSKMLHPKVGPQSNNNNNNNIRNNLKNMQQRAQGERQAQYQLPTVVPVSVRNSNPLLLNNVHRVEAAVAVQLLQHGDPACAVNSVQPMPRNIPDVQTIERMHFKQLQRAAFAAPAHFGRHEPHANRTSPFRHEAVAPAVVYAHGCEQGAGGGGGDNNSNNNNRAPHLQPLPLPVPVPMAATPITVAPTSENCDSERTSSRPAVVILSGDEREVSGLTFGFDVNEQLLSDDVCDSFAARFYVPPDVFHSHNHDKIVNFIGLAWEDTINQANGKVKYYSDQL